uniref:AAA_12 domain-containing protein n=2 Tax=Caenorhabditis japonica TaxID=281687 RepID=A0A8R1HPB8_CAEJA
MSSLVRHIPAVSLENNAMRNLAAVSGANVLPDMEPFPVRQANLTFEGFTLSEEQARIIGTLSFDTFTALAVNCGPGTGKTTTLVLAVLSRMQNTSMISMMAAMSNGAVTAAVTKLTDIDRSRRCRAVRLISKQNLSAVAGEHRTPLDYPTIWPEFLLNKVRRFDRRHEPLNRDVVDAAVYLCRFGKLVRKTLRRADLRTALNSKPVKNLVPLFFDLYTPVFILGTCASVRSFFSAPDMSRFSDKVDLMLLDEASQLPRYAFTAACHTFPKARPVLIGDVHQLPPYEDPDLPGILSRYAVGSVLQDASSFGRCPTLPLLRVHRCPKAITELLGETFYNGELVSTQPAVDSLFELRTMRLPYTHPLVVIHHNYPHRREDTSLVNEREVEDALRYAAGLWGSRTEPSIAILGFYKGGVDYASRRAPDYVQVLTVDSAQGREYDYVLVLTSRTSGSSTFLDNRQRINVALSRTRKSCIIFAQARIHHRHGSLVPPTTHSPSLPHFANAVTDTRSITHRVGDITLAHCASSTSTLISARGSSLSGRHTLSQRTIATAAADSLRTTADHRSTVCHSAPPRSHTHWPTNQDATADQSAPAGKLLEQPRPFRGL